jgi:hypothetical protein
VTLLQRIKNSIKKIIGVFLSLQTQKSRYMSTTPIISVKDKYKIRNWQSYNKSLCQGGSLTLWLNNSVLKEWEQASKKKKAVGEQTYTDSIISCCLLMKINYGLKLRQSTGFMQSLLFLM